MNNIEPLDRKEVTQPMIRARAINRILNLTDGWTMEELMNIEDTMELVALSYDVERAIKYIKL